MNGRAHRVKITDERWAVFNRVVDAVEWAEAQGLTPADTVARMSTVSSREIRPNHD